MSSGLPLQPFGNLLAVASACSRPRTDNGPSGPCFICSTLFSVSPCRTKYIILVDIGIF